MKLLAKLLFQFAGLMLDKLMKKRNQGWSGWEHLSEMDINARLREHLEKRDYVDVANFALFGWANQQRMKGR